LHFRPFYKKKGLIPFPSFSLAILLNRSQGFAYIISSCKVAVSLCAWVNRGVPGFFFRPEMSYDVWDGIQKYLICPDMQQALNWLGRGS